ncbi:DUF429 domain-containing protein [Salinibacterium sp.]|uniref:DUF429 domain-containing protein n=1 Tax=Salinibacterium sp. TaxID=1915057 RepID=UPI00286B1155|nr:DUF429 domain-containing protein [Salinibacterium sp.]
MAQYFGVDLAWGEGSVRKRANETGLAAIDEHGVVSHAGWARGIDEVAGWLLEHAEPGAIIAIDAPLVIPNPTGMRLAERQVGMGYGRWHVAANASNSSMGWTGGVTLRRRLEAAGFTYIDGSEPPSTTGRSFFECYPYTTIVGMDELGYDDKRPRYKRPVRGLPAADARQVRALACDELVRRVAALATAEPPIDIASHPVSAALLLRSPLTNSEYKHREDLLDSLLCAWTASIWHFHGSARVQVLGVDADRDEGGRRPTIVAPARESQRVAGRAMRTLGTDRETAVSEKRR